MAISRFDQPTPFQYKPLDIKTMAAAKAMEAKAKAIPTSQLQAISGSGLDYVTNVAGEKSLISDRKKVINLTSEFNSKLSEINEQAIANPNNPDLLKKMNSLNKEYNQIILPQIQVNEKRQKNYNKQRAQVSADKNINSSPWRANKLNEEEEFMLLNPGYIPEESITIGDHVDRQKIMREGINNIETFKTAWANPKTREGYITSGSREFRTVERIGDIFDLMMINSGIMEDINQETEYMVRTGQISPEEAPSYAKNKREALKLQAQGTREKDHSTAGLTSDATYWKKKEKESSVAAIQNYTHGEQMKFENYSNAASSLNDLKNTKEDLEIEIENVTDERKKETLKKELKNVDNQISSVKGTMAKFNDDMKNKGYKSNNAIIVENFEEYANITNTHVMKYISEENKKTDPGIVGAIASGNDSYLKKNYPEAYKKAAIDFKNDVLAYKDDRGLFETTGDVIASVGHDSYEEAIREAHREIKRNTDNYLEENSVEAATTQTQSVEKREQNELLFDINESWRGDFERNSQYLVAGDIQFEDYIKERTYKDKDNKDVTPTRKNAKVTITDTPINGQHKLLVTLTDDAGNTLVDENGKPASLLVAPAKQESIKKHILQLAQQQFDAGNKQEAMRLVGNIETLPHLQNIVPGIPVNGEITTEIYEIKYKIKRTKDNTLQVIDPETNKPETGLFIIVGGVKKEVKSFTDEQELSTSFAISKYLF